MIVVIVVVLYRRRRHRKSKDITPGGQQLEIIESNSRPTSQDFTEPESLEQPPDSFQETGDAVLMRQRSSSRRRSRNSVSFSDVEEHVAIDQSVAPSSGIVDVASVRQEITAGHVGQRVYVLGTLCRTGGPCIWAG
jgi:hypothetical protein